MPRPGKPRSDGAAPCDNDAADPTQPRTSATVPVLATFFSVRRGRDAFFKFFMREVFPARCCEQEAKFGIKFWAGTTWPGWDFDNVML
jgi:hypothetical protein